MRLSRRGRRRKASDDEAPQLLTEDEDRDFRDRWQGIQNQFVDDPRGAVHAANALVADVMQTLAGTFAQHKKDPEVQWGQGETDRHGGAAPGLRRYRSFFCGAPVLLLPTTTHLDDDGSTLRILPLQQLAPWVRPTDCASAPSLPSPRVATATSVPARRAA